VSPFDCLEKPIEIPENLTEVAVVVDLNPDDQNWSFSEKSADIPPMISALRDLKQAESLRKWPAASQDSICLYTLVQTTNGIGTATGFTDLPLCPLYGRATRADSQ
jgi:hypothetical protein